MNKVQMVRLPPCQTRGYGSDSSISRVAKKAEVILKPIIAKRDEVVAGSAEPSQMKICRSGNGSLPCKAGPLRGGAACRANSLLHRTPSVRWALASLSLSMLLSSLGTSIANVALPTLAQAFSASFQQVPRIVPRYLL